VWSSLHGFLHNSHNPCICHLHPPFPPVHVLIPRPPLVHIVCVLVLLLDVRCLFPYLLQSLLVLFLVPWIPLSSILKPVCSPYLLGPASLSSGNPFPPILFSFFYRFSFLYRYLLIPSSVLFSLGCNNPPPHMHVSSSHCPSAIADFLCSLPPINSCPSHSIHPHFLLHVLFIFSSWLSFFLSSSSSSSFFSS